jgi:hypothetical protein
MIGRGADELVADDRAAFEEMNMRSGCRTSNCDNTTQGARQGATSRVLSRGWVLGLHSARMPSSRLFAGLLLATLSGTLSAANFTVSNVDDAGAGSLRRRSGRQCRGGARHDPVLDRNWPKTICPGSLTRAGRWRSS